MSFELLPEASKPQTKPRSGLQVAKDFIKEQARPYVRAATNVTSTALGLPGDVLSLANQYVAGPIAEQVTGQKAVPYEQTYIGKVLPTTQQHKANLQSIAPEYLKPRNEVERFTDDVIEDTASLFFPLKGKVPFKKTLTRAFTTSLGANVVGEGVKGFSGDEGDAAIAKAGSLFLLSVLNKPKAIEAAGDLYKRAEALLPKGATVGAQNLNTNLTGLKNKILAGRPVSALSPSEKFVVDEADTVLGLVKNGKVEVNSLVAAKRSLNEKLDKVLFDTPDKKTRARARKLATNVQHDIKGAIKDYGRENPEFYKNYSNADEAFGTIAKSNFVTRFVENNLRYSPVTAGLVHAIGGPIGGAVSGATVVYPTAKLIYRIKNSPVLRKHYSEVIQAAAKEDAIVFNKELKKLDEALQKEEKHGQYELLD